MLDAAGPGKKVDTTCRPRIDRIRRDFSTALRICSIRWKYPQGLHELSADINNHCARALLCHHKPAAGRACLLIGFPGGSSPLWLDCLKERTVPKPAWAGMDIQDGLSSSSYRIGTDSWVRIWTVKVSAFPARLRRGISITHSRFWINPGLCGFS